MDKNVSVSKLDKLTKLHGLLLDFCTDSVQFSDDWLVFKNFLCKVKDMITDERRRLGYKVVYPIVNGCSEEALFEGTSDECDIYVDIFLENNPEMRGNLIVLDL